MEAPSELAKLRKKVAKLAKADEPDAARLAKLRKKLAKLEGGGQQQVVQQEVKKKKKRAAAEGEDGRGHGRACVPVFQLQLP